MGRHHRLRSEIDAFVDGELSAPRRGAMEIHRQACIECERTVALTVRVALNRCADQKRPELSTARLRRWLATTELG